MIHDLSSAILPRIRSMLQISAQAAFRTLPTEYTSTTMSDSITYVDDSPIHGKRLFARTFIPAGQVIGTLTNEHTMKDGDHVLWIDEENGIHVQCDLRYINHSDNPNAAYYDNLEVCAVRDIHPNNKITHNYEQDL